MGHPARDVHSTNLKPVPRYFPLWGPTEFFKGSEAGGLAAVGKGNLAEPLRTSCRFIFYYEYVNEHRNQNLCD